MVYAEGLVALSGRSEPVASRGRILISQAVADQQLAARSVKWPTELAPCLTSTPEQLDGSRELTRGALSLERGGLAGRVAHAFCQRDSLRGRFGRAFVVSGPGQQDRSDCACVD